MENEKNEQIKNEAIIKLNETLKEMEELTQVEALIKNNILQFEHKDISYRVRKPSPEEKRKCNKAKMEKYLSLIQDPNYLLKEQWVATYKEKGIDIDKLDTELLELQNKQEVLFLKLAKAEGKVDIDTLKQQISDLKEKQTGISFRKAELLQYSLETVLDEYVHSYYGYLLTEKKEDSEWKRVFDNYEDFINNKDDRFFMKVMHFLSVLILTEGNNE